MSPAASPAPIWNLINGFAAYWALQAAVELGVFDALSAGSVDNEMLAALVGVPDPGDLETLCALLVGVELLDTDGTNWSNTPAADAYLTTAAPTSMAGLVHASPGPHAAWPVLSTTLRAGRPADDVLNTVVAGYPVLVQATGRVQRSVAAAIAESIPELSSADAIVDFGCGSGAWLAELLPHAPRSAWGVGIDLPTVTPVADATLRELRGHNVALVDGDYLEIELPVTSCAVAVLAHVLRSESPDRAEALVDRALRLLGDSGVLIVADYFRPDVGSSSEALHAAQHDITLALTMRACTPGRGVTERQLADWCRIRGWEISESLEPLPRQRVLLVRRPIA